MVDWLEGAVLVVLLLLSLFVRVQVAQARELQGEVELERKQTEQQIQHEQGLRRPAQLELPPAARSDAPRNRDFFVRQVALRSLRCE